MPDVLVTGAGPTAMLAALDLAEVGLAVELVLGPEDAWPDRAVADPDGGLAAALARIAAPVAPEHAGFSEAEPVSAPRIAPLLRSVGGAWAPQAEPEVLGIPGQPLAREVQRLLGVGGALRVWRDRLIPVLTVGKTQSFGRLVRNRIGAAALARLVEPPVVERFGIRADEVDAAVAAPGLNETFTRAGSLTAAALAYADRNVARETVTHPRGGWLGARAALLERLSLYSVVLSEDAAVAAREGDAGWEIERASGAMTRARGLIIDAGDDTNWVALDGLAAARGRRRIRVVDQAEADHTELPASSPDRVYAEIDIPRPDLRSAVDGAPGAEALQLIEIAGESWAVRFAPEPADSGDEAWRAILSGPARALDAPAQPADELRARLDAVLAAAEVATVRGAEWRVKRGVAVFATVAERHRSDAVLTAWHAEESERVAVGAALHGADLGRAVEEGHRAAVALRRRLTGIAA